MTRFIKFTLILLFHFYLFHVKVFSEDNNTIEKLNAYDVKFYKLDLEVNNLSEYIKGSVTILAEIVSSEVDTILVELTDSALVDSILINDQPVAFNHSENLINIILNETATSGTLLNILVYYSLTDSDPNPNRGVTTKQISSGKSVTWTLSEPFYSKNWFPCKQVLDDKADSLYLFFTVADSLRVGSNGILTAVTELPGGKRRFEWKSYYPTAYYLISFAVADYLDYSFYAKINDTDSILVQNYVYNDSTFFLSNKELIDATADLLQVFDESYGSYPFHSEKYGHCIAPIGGGMEHQTMTTLGNFSFLLVAHELSHQWFGDNVTCQNWQDIWINEGFASYSEYIALEKLYSKVELKNWLSEAFDLIVSEPDGSVFVPANDSTNSGRIFNYRLSYRKGAYLIHMIRHELSDDLFFQVLKTFQETYKNDVADVDDFIQVIQDVSQRNFSTFFNQWYYGEGYPKLNFYWDQRHDSLIVRTEQETTVPSVTSFFDLLIDLKISFLDGSDTLVQFRPTEPEAEFKFHVNKKIIQIIPDPDKNLLAEIQSIIKERDADSASQFSVFPNPASNEIYIENYDIGFPFTARLYDSKGVFITEIESLDAIGSINISSLPTGIYQVIVGREKYKEVFKIAKH